MNQKKESVTLLRIPLIEENYSWSTIASIAIHGVFVLVALFGARLFPQTITKLGSGPGGGTGGDLVTVGVVEQLSGGAGMVKPAMLPKPPALEEESPKEVEKAIPLPGTLDSKKKAEVKKNAEVKKSADVKKNAEKTSKDLHNIIPTASEPGSGGIAGSRAGTGGGMGGGNGVSIGTGSGGFGNSWYARAVESKISDNWQKPPAGMHVEMTYSFFINANGTIYGIKKEKSSGNLQIDLTAERAINSCNPLTAPPPEFRDKAIQFVAQFVYPSVQ
jgi:outer membrane biosynthesis protein TonB